MPEKSLAERLQVRPGSQILLLNAPSGYENVLVDLPEGAVVTRDSAGAYDFILVFVHNKADIDSFSPTAINALKPSGVLWFAYPKRTSGVQTDVHRDVGWDSVHGVGWEGVRQIAIDDTWSALRFRPSADIRSRRGKA